MADGPNKELRMVIENAKTELQGRRAQRTSSYDDRLAQLVRIQQSLENGHIKPSAVRQKVEELLSEGRGTLRSPASRGISGKRKVRMDVPAEAAQSGVGWRAVIKKGPSKSIASASLSECVAQIDNRMVVLLTTKSEGREPALTRIELAFLASLRQSLLRNLGEVPSDAVMLEDVVSFCELIDKQLIEMKEDSSHRLESLCAHLRARLVGIGSDSVAISLQQRARDLHHRFKSAGHCEKKEKELIQLWKEAHEISKESNRSNSSSLLGYILNNQ